MRSAADVVVLCVICMWVCSMVNTEKTGQYISMDALYFGQFLRILRTFECLHCWVIFPAISLWLDNGLTLKIPQKFINIVFCCFVVCCLSLPFVGHALRTSQTIWNLHLLPFVFFFFSFSRAKLNSNWILCDTKGFSLAICTSPIVYSCICHSNGRDNATVKIGMLARVIFLFILLQFPQ